MANPTPSPADILYHEGPCIAVNKPTGVLTQSPPGVDSLEHHVRQYVAARESLQGKFYLGVPHRLDRPVSGVVVFGRHIRATQRLSKQFERRTVRKHYWAVVEGNVNPRYGVWQDTLRKIPGRAFVEVVPNDHPTGKRAMLRYRVVANGEGWSLLVIRLETGRTHQIRVQAAHRGFPVVGDDQYGAQLGFGRPFEDARERAIALHARKLVFDHPKSRRRTRVVAPFPENWGPFLDQTPAKKDTVGM